MTFHIGQKVVCVNVGPNKRGITPENLRKGSIYTVSKIGYCPLSGLTGLRLLEATPNRGDNWFYSWRFRPVKTTSIEIFRQMLKPVKEDA